MIAVLQRVSSSRVDVDGVTVGAIGIGLNVLLGVTREDSDADVALLVRKIVDLRIFADEAGKMNRSLRDVGGAMLVISQFTLTGSVKKGRRPSFDASAAPDEAKRLYELFIAMVRAEGISVSHGVFGAHMDVVIHNDGPVTFVLDSKAL